MEQKNASGEKLFGIDTSGWATPPEKAAVAADGSPATEKANEQPGEAPVVESVQQDIPAVNTERAVDPELKKFIDFIDTEGEPIEEPESVPVTNEGGVPQGDVNTEMLQRLIELEKDPLKKKLLEAMLAGEDVLETFEQIKPVNYSKVSDDDVYREYLKTLSLSQEEIDEEMDVFSNKRPVEKKMLVNPMRERLVEKQNQRIVSESPKKQQEIFWKQKSTEAQTELSSIISKIAESKEYKFVKFTPEMVEQLRKECLADNAPPVKKDKSGNILGYDVPELVKKSFLLKFDRQYAKAIAEMSKKEGYVELYESRLRPNANRSTGGTVPVQEASFGAAMEEVAGKFLPRAQTIKKN